jgi:hypothetical protein
MAFMSAVIGRKKELFLVSDELEEIVFCKYNNINLPEGHYDDEDEPCFDEDVEEEVRYVLEEFQISNFDIVLKYYGQLSADGYMDQTDYYLGDTQAEVAQQLLDMYYSGEVEYMDAEEVDDMNWLQSIVDAEPQE